MPGPWTLRLRSMNSKDQFPLQNCFRYHFLHVRWRSYRQGMLVSPCFHWMPHRYHCPNLDSIHLRAVEDCNRYEYLSTILAVHARRSGSLQMTDKPGYLMIYTKRICRTHRPHIHPTCTPHSPYIHPTSTLHPPHIVR